MPETAADILVEALIDWGVEVVFGLPGDGINGIMEALRTRQDRVRFIQVRHEEAAAFMACGYAKFTGKLGVCLATSGPGALHLLNGLYDAKMDGQPVLAITGNQYHDLMDTYGQQDVATDRVFADVAVYNTRVMGAAHVEQITDLACRHALTYRGVAHITFPADLQEEEPGEDTLSRHNVWHHTSSRTAAPGGLPPERDLARAAEVLNACERVAILAGRGALGATDLLIQAAERLQAPIAKALLGKAAVPDDHPLTTGTIGILGTRPSTEAMERCDGLLIVGSSFPYTEYLPEPGQARGVQIDLDPARIALRYPVEVGLVGDSVRTLEALLPLLRQKEESGYLREIRSSMDEWRRLMEKRGALPDKPLKPQVVAHELGRQAAEDAVVACDSGSNTTWWAQQFPVKRGQAHSVSGGMASMGCALPYAAAAQLAYPGRQCLAIAGDGGFSMLMVELLTCVKYSLPVKVFVLKNDTLAQIKWEQMAFLGNPEYGCDLQPMDYAAFATACGATGLTLDDPADCAGVVEEALRTPGPVVVECVVDPHEMTMPPDVDEEQVRNMMQALAEGEPTREMLAKHVIQERIREMV
jgi:pyruvate dehydrogenase (quinone)